MHSKSGINGKNLFFSFIGMWWKKTSHRCVLHWKKKDLMITCNMAAIALRSNSVSINPAKGTAFVGSDISDKLEEIDPTATRTELVDP